MMRLKALHQSKVEYFLFSDKTQDINQKKHKGHYFYYLLDWAVQYQLCWTNYQVGLSWAT